FRFEERGIYCLVARASVGACVPPRISAVWFGERGQHRHQVGAVCADGGGEELPRLRGVGAPWQVVRQEFRRLFGGCVQAVAQSLTGDLGKPRVVIARTVDAVAVQLIREIGVDVGVRRGGQRNRGGHDGRQCE